MLKSMNSPAEFRKCKKEMIKRGLSISEEKEMRRMMNQKLILLKGGKK